MHHPRLILRALRRGLIPACVLVLGWNPAVPASPVQARKPDQPVASPVDAPHPAFARALRAQKAGEHEKAVRAYTRIIQAGSTDPEVLAGASYNRGILLLKVGDHDQAIHDFTRALEAKPGWPEAHYNRGAAAQHAGRMEMAADDFTRVIRLTPGFVPARFQRAQVRIAGNDLHQAAHDLVRVLELDPSHTRASIALGLIRVDQGRLGEAVAVYTRGLAAQPARPRLHFHRANALYCLGRIRRAVADLESSLEMDPGHAASANNLAWILATSPDPGIRDPGRAVALARLAVAAARDTTGHLDTLAAAQASRGDFKAAVEIQEQALALARAEGRDAAGFARRLGLYRQGRALTVPAPGPDRDS
jgi:serine/threonine-protein kinase